MSRHHKWLFTAIAGALVVPGVLAILSETHAGHSRWQGSFTLLGADAIWFGRTCLLLAVLPLLVWLPPRRVGVCITAWWLGLMVWLLGPLVWR